MSHAYVFSQTITHESLPKIPHGNAGKQHLQLRSWQKQNRTSQGKKLVLNASRTSRKCSASVKKQNNQSTELSCTSNPQTMIYNDTHCFYKRQFMRQTSVDHFVLAYYSFSHASILVNISNNMLPQHSISQSTCFNSNQYLKQHALISINISNNMTSTKRRS